jgi:hypothetical protein
MNKEWNMSGKHAPEAAGAARGGGTGARKGRRRGRTRAGWRRLLSTIASLLLVASVIKELRTPREQRTWHGMVLGFVPYDLRPPTLQRLRESVWNPASHQLFTSRVFGVGWSLNLHEVWFRLRSAISSAAS